MSWTQEEMHKLYEKVQRKAMTDEKFREELLADPNVTLEKIAGKQLPDGCNIKVIEQDPAYAATIVLPKLVGDALDDAELDKVAGGVIVSVIVDVIV